MDLRFAICDVRLPSPRTGRRGFSFTEILFAVMILGIGFIMVAAMFPVAIQQTQNSVDDTFAAGIARSGADVMAQIAQGTWPANVPPDTVSFPPGFQPVSMLPPTFQLNRTPFSLQQLNLFIYPPTARALVFPAGVTSMVLPGAVWNCCDRIHDSIVVTTKGSGQHNHFLDLWAAVAPNLIQANDPRYAWVALWKRDELATLNAGVLTLTPMPYAQVIVIACRSRNGPSYSAVPSQTNNMSDLTVQMIDGGPDTSLVPSIGTASLNSTALGTSTIKFTGSTNAALRAAEGAYVVIGDDSDLFGSARHGALSGHVYRLGTFDPASNTWEFAPGEGLTSGEILNSLDTSATYSVYVIGSGPDPNAANANPTGPAQDIAVYSTFVPCSN